MRNFCKSVEIAAASGARPRKLACLRRLKAPPPESSVVTHAYYYNYIEFVSSAKCVLLLSKKKKINKITTLNVLSAFCFFPTFTPIFI